MGGKKQSIWEKIVFSDFLPYLVVFFNNRKL